KLFSSIFWLACFQACSTESTFIGLTQWISVYRVSVQRFSEIRTGKSPDWNPRRVRENPRLGAFARTPTLIGCWFLKIVDRAAFAAVRDQHRRESMKTC
ncbi:MAG TPA: hypothetical protein PK956_09145, partial [Burkholderiaceae bacterium]|nr:hypothetical protein [Burkholderiaceae bacterium]